jgi:hypothetical protein
VSQSTLECSASELGCLEAQVQSRLAGRVRNLQLLAQGRCLVLKGNAPCYYAKQLAQHAVMQASGFPILANEIAVSVIGRALGGDA